MRHIKFRGKSQQTGEWVEGSYFCVPEHNTHAIRYWSEGAETIVAHSVHPETVGQFTGLVDRNGKEIYEGDILRGAFIDEDGDFIPMSGKVMYNDNYYAAFYLENDAGATYFWKILAGALEVIGNIHENPELLEPKTAGE